LCFKMVGSREGVEQQNTKGDNESGKGDSSRGGISKGKDGRLSSLAKIEVVPVKRHWKTSPGGLQGNRRRRAVCKGKTNTWDS